MACLIIAVGFSNGAGRVLTLSALREDTGASQRWRAAGRGAI